MTTQVNLSLNEIYPKSLSPSWFGWISKGINYCDSTIALNAIRLATSLTSATGLKTIYCLSLKFIEEESVNSWVANAVKVNAFFNRFFYLNLLMVPSIFMIPFILKKIIDLGGIFYSNWKIPLDQRLERENSLFFLNSFSLFIQSNIVPCLYECLSKFLEEEMALMQVLKIASFIHYFASAIFRATSLWYANTFKMNMRVSILSQDSERFNLYLIQRIQQFLNSSDSSIQLLEEVDSFLENEVPHTQFKRSSRKIKSAIAKKLRNIWKEQEESREEFLQKKLDFINGYLKLVEELTASNKKNVRIVQEMFDFHKKMVKKFAFFSETLGENKKVNKESIGKLEQNIRRIEENIREALGFKDAEEREYFAVQLAERDLENMVSVSNTGSVHSRGKRRITHLLVEDEEEMETAFPASLLREDLEHIRSEEPPRTGLDRYRDGFSPIFTEIPKSEEEQKQIRLRDGLISEMEAIEQKLVALPAVPPIALGDEGAPNLTEVYRPIFAQGLDEEVKLLLKELQNQIYLDGFSLWDIPLACSSLLDTLSRAQSSKGRTEDLFTFLSINTMLLSLKLGQHLWQGVKRLRA